ncbi:PH domain-containing protein [Candidatus Woesearchaeota archaeon]|nr:PH domain-containing protein [Candidatus Woesearchaeota archaeon]
MDPNISNILESNEKVVWQGIVNRKVLFTILIISLAVTFIIGIVFVQQTIQPKQISGSIVGITIILIGLLISLFSFFSDIVKNYAITKKRVIIKSGLIGTDFKSIYFDQIKNIIVDVGLIGKIFGVGSVKIDIGKTETYSTGGGRTSRGYSQGQIRTRTMYDVLKHIDNPYEVYKYLQKTLEGRKESLYSGRADRESNPKFYK